MARRISRTTDTILDPDRVAQFLQGRTIVAAEWREMRRSVEGGTRHSLQKLGILVISLDNGRQFRIAMVNYRSVTMEWLLPPD